MGWEEVGAAQVLLGAGDAGECSAPLGVGGPDAWCVAPELTRSLWDDSLHLGCVSLRSGCLEKVGMHAEVSSRRNFRRAQSRGDRC